MTFVVMWACEARGCTIPMAQVRGYWQVSFSYPCPGPFIPVGSRLSVVDSSPVSGAQATGKSLSAIPFMALFSHLALMSTSSSLCQVLCGCPLLHYPWGFQVMAWLKTFVVGLWSAWPINPQGPSCLACRGYSSWGLTWRLAWWASSSTGTKGWFCICVKQSDLVWREDSLQSQMFQKITHLYFLCHRHNFVNIHYQEARLDLVLKLIF